MIRPLQLGEAAVVNGPGVPGIERKGPGEVGNRGEGFPQLQQGDAPFVKDLGVPRVAAGSDGKVSDRLITFAHDPSGPLLLIETMPSTSLRARDGHGLVVGSAIASWPHGVVTMQQGSPVIPRGDVASARAKRAWL